MREVLITGVSSGLGRALARAHLEAGDRVRGLSRRRPEGLEEGGRLRFYSCDLAQEERARAGVEEILDGASRIDVVWLNAGVLGRVADMAECGLDELRRTMDVNLWANKTVLDALFGRAIPVDQVVAISSGAAVNGSRGWNGYSLSKAALNMLVRLYAAERPATHFTALAPGLVDTAMQDQLCGRESDPRFPSIDRLKAARGTEAMPGPDAAARRLIGLLARLRSRHESGAFVDVRTMDA